MNSHEHLSFLEAADFCGTSRSKVWRATKQGDLLAEKRQKNGRPVWTVALDDLIDWADKEGLNVQNEQSNAREQSGPEHSNSHEQSRTVASEHPPEQSSGLHEQLLDRFEKTQRRAIYLELQLQQSQRLLCERNDDQHEREARAREAEALAELAREEAELARQEAAQAKIELETLKTELATREAEWTEKRKPWYRKLFSRSAG
jgi:hypothetical protein